MNDRIYTKSYKKSQDFTNLIALICLVGAVALTIGGVFFATAYDRKMKSAIANASSIKEFADLAASGKNKDRIFTLTSNVVYYTNYTVKVKVKDTEKEVAWYYFVKLADNSCYISVRSTQNLINQAPETLTTFTGVLRSDPYRTENIKIMQDLSGWSEEEVKSSLADYELSDEYQQFPAFRKNDDDFYIMFFIGAALFVIFGATAYFATGGKERKNKKILSKFISAEEADENFSLECEKEDKLEIGKSLLTKNWLFSGAKSDVFLFPVEEIVWAYKNIIQYRYNGIPTGKKSYSVCFNLSDGSTIYLASGKMAETGVDIILDYIVENWHNVIIGFDASRQAAWANKDQRAQFIADWKNKKQNA